MNRHEFDQELWERRLDLTASAFPAPCDGPSAVRLAAAPVHMPTTHDQAGHELALANALVLNAPTAALSLDLLVNEDELHPQGALVFACLLFLTGRAEGAQFWWQYAAGSGNYTAAYCLHLFHLSLGETRDAEYWRGQAEHLVAHPRPLPARLLRSPRPLLPADVRHDILDRCHQGLDPCLPIRMEAVINRLRHVEDAEFGEIPQPDSGLSGALTGPDDEPPADAGTAPG